ncbi:MAG: UbiA family prenyltransferase [Haloarculaceae archaeon]
MPLARHGSGAGAVVRALASQVHPVFMLPPVATALFGATLAGSFSPPLAALHALAVSLALYTAHVKDGYVDFHVRGEDDDHPLTARGCRFALAGASVAFAACTLALGLAAGPGAALLTAPGWVIGYSHAPSLDTHPVGATAGYPAGIALALLGGYYVQARSLSPLPLALAAVFLVVLSGIKVIDDAQDLAYDRSIAKRTVAVVLGPRRARRVAYALMAAGMTGVIALAAALPDLPDVAALATLPFGLVALVARRGDPELATMLLIRGSYVFLAVLVAAVWFG